ncbi:CMRF35-like molecule 1 isoform X3 [Paroedura picta]|uniref:CMRF35-like molecule 1 isoform X3 n=1 Tax=Paroedura picta TaxID=143630 RepID=UPI004055C7CD
MWSIIMQWLLYACAILFIPGGFSELLTCPSTVRAPLGGSLSILCNYTDYASYNKYCCKGEIWHSCEKIITTKSSLVETQGRISINDSRSLQAFNIIIENLTLEDEGKYWCGIDRTLAADPSYPISVEIFRELLPPTTTAAVTTGYFSTVPNDTKGPSEITTRLLLLIVLLVLVVVLLVGGLLVMWRLKKQKAAKASGCTLQPMVPRRAEGNVSNATMAANIKPNGKKPSPSSDPDLNNTLHVEYASVKNSAPPTQPQVPSTNTEDVSYATIKFPTQGEQEIYANLKYTSNPS